MSLQFTKIIDHSLYPRSALADARQAYRDYCSLKIVPLVGDSAEINITIKDSYEKDSRQVVLDFLNYMLDRSAQVLFEEDSE